MGIKKTADDQQGNGEQPVVEYAEVVLFITFPDQQDAGQQCTQRPSAK